MIPLFDKLKFEVRMQIVWDEKKNTVNKSIHKIDFNDAAEVFSNPFQLDKSNMRNEYDFSNGRQGRFAGVEFEVIGSQKSDNPHEYFAVCVTNENTDLTPMKIYKILSGVENINFTVKGDKNKTFVCPASYFLPLHLTANDETLLSAKSKELVLA
jgi:uncharacterized DUF497 family protein